MRFSTKNPKQVEIFSVVDVPGGGREQVWSPLTLAASSVADSDRSELRVRLSDAILQMLAAFLAEREGALTTGSVAPHRRKPPSRMRSTTRRSALRDWRGRTGGRMTRRALGARRRTSLHRHHPELTDVPELVPGQLYEIGSAQLTLGGCVANTSLALAAAGASTRVCARARQRSAGRDRRVALLAEHGMDLADVTTTAG